MKPSMKIGILLIVMACVAGGVVYWLTQKGPGARVMVTVDSIRKVAQLATVEYSISTLVEKTFRSSYGLGKTNSSTLLALYSGRVRGLVNLEKINIELKKDGIGTSDKGDGHVRASIHFPHGSIVVNEVAIDPDVDHMTEKVIWKKTGFNPPSENQREAVRREALKTILNTAIKKGIVEKTKNNAKMILSEFLRGFGIEADITFDKKAYDPELAATQ